MTLKNGENSIVVQIDFKCHINVKLALDGDTLVGSAWLVARWTLLVAAAAAAVVSTLLIIMATMRLHTPTHMRRHRISIGNTHRLRERERGSEGRQQSLDSWPWLDRWFVSVQVIHEFRWTPINNHIRPVPVPFPCQRPLWPCWQHEKWPMAAKMEESSRFSFAFSQVCGTGSCCRCVHTYLCVCNCFFQRLLFLVLSLLLSAASHSFVAATLIYLTVPGFDILTQITADQADSLHPPSSAL